MTPEYTSQARLLIDSEETVYTRPTVGERGLEQPTAIDQAVITSQVQVLNSRDIAQKIIDKLKLKRNPELNTTLKEPGLLYRMRAKLGLEPAHTPAMIEETVARNFAKNLVVSPVLTSHVINVNFTSKDPELAAKVANSLTEEYVVWQRDAKLRVNKGASRWLSAQIASLREKVKTAEAEVERFRARTGQQPGRGAMTLNAQQLSELNSQLILAKAKRSEADARARLIQDMLRNKQDINAASDVLKSQLIQRLLEQQASITRTRAELSATLLPAHPRIQQLDSELRGLRREIRTEVNKIASSLKNEAEIARAREESLIRSLNALQDISADSSEDTIKLRALQREAKANRDLLESYLARYRDASSRRDSDSVPAQATIISRAYPSSVPSFPRLIPTSLLAMAATFLLVFSYIISSALLSMTGGASRTRGQPTERAEPSIDSQPRHMDRTAEPNLIDSPQKAQDRAKAADESEEDLADQEMMKSAAAHTVAATDSDAADPESESEEQSSTGSPVIYSDMADIAKHLTGQFSGDQGYRILVTASREAIDATECALDLARECSQWGSKVMVVDASEGAKTVAAALGLPRGPGFTDVMTGQSILPDVIQQDPHSDVKIIPTGLPLADRPDKKIVAGRTEIMDALDRNYDVVILCAPNETARKIFQAMDADFDAGVILAPGGAAEALSRLTQGNFLGFTVTGLEIVYFAPSEVESAPTPAAASSA